MQPALCCDITPTLSSCGARHMYHLHLKHGVLHGHMRVFVHTVDSSSNLDWKSYGWALIVASTTRYSHPPNYQQLGSQKSFFLPLFRALTGCDTSQILGCGKNTSWTVWNSITELTDTLLSQTSETEIFTMESEHMHALSIYCIHVQQGLSCWQCE